MTNQTYDRTYDSIVVIPKTKFFRAIYKRLPFTGMFYHEDCLIITENFPEALTHLPVRFTYQNLKKFAKIMVIAEKIYYVRREK